MGRILLVGRLALRDLRRRRTETVLLLLAIVTATTTLTLGLVLRDAASDPYQSTREATYGPDIVVGTGPVAGLSRLEELASGPGVTAHSGPYPVIPAELRTADHTSDVQIIGRDAEPAAVDQPKVLAGHWVIQGGVVVEAAFADALGVGVGDTVTLSGRSFEVVGVAVTAAMPPYPQSTCLVHSGCAIGSISDEEARALPVGLLRNPGLVWLTRADVLSLADADSLSYVMNLKLADPDDVQAFFDAHVPTSRDAPMLVSWREILADATEQARDTQILLLIGAWLLGLLAVASLAVLVGGRMAEQTRRVGLLKAVGGTPGVVAAVLLAEYVLVAVVAAAAGLAIGSLTAPLLAESSAGLIGSAGTPAMTVSTVTLVFGLALAVAAVATVVPALRAAGTSTVSALADAARTPRRTGWLIAVSARLPVPLLLALRAAGRRPQRAVLGAAAIAITVSGVFVALVLNTFLTTQPPGSGLDAAHVGLMRRVLLVVMVVLFILTAVNAVFLTWATVLDNRHSSALARALGATPSEVAAGLAAAQVLPALVGAVLGVFPGGFALFTAITAITGGDGDGVPTPSLWQRLVVVLATVVVVGALTAIPARLGGRRPVTEILHAELT